MKRALLGLSLLIAIGTEVRSQDARLSGSEPKIPLTEQATVFDAAGRAVLTGRLRATGITGSVESPVTNIRLVLTDVGPLFYNYVSGWATFYDEQGVRCGEGLFKVSALAPGESAEVETPGIRVTCAAAAWRITATNLLTPTTETANPGTPLGVAPQATGGAAALPAPASTNLDDRTMVLNINGEDHYIQIGKPMVLKNTSGPVTLILKRP